jgi:hypothetical protein
MLPNPLLMANSCSLLNMNLESEVVAKARVSVFIHLQAPLHQHFD